MIDASCGHVDPIDMMSERVEICFGNRLDGPRYECRLVVRQLSAIMTSVNSGKTVVVTNCTARTRGALEHLAMTPSRLVAPTDQVARQWVEDLRKHPVTVIPDCYYAGRGYGEANIAAEYAGARRAIVSAGMGLVWSDANLPAYDVTISWGANTVADHLASRGEASSDWWRKLTCALNDPQDIESNRSRHGRGTRFGLLCDGAIDATNNSNQDQLYGYGTHRVATGELADLEWRRQSASAISEGYCRRGLRAGPLQEALA